MNFRRHPCDVSEVVKRGEFISFAVFFLLRYYFAFQIGGDARDACCNLMVHWERDLTHVRDHAIKRSAFLTPLDVVSKGVCVGPTRIRPALWTLHNLMTDGMGAQTRPTPSTPASSSAWKTGANDPWSDTVFTTTRRFTFRAYRQSVDVVYLWSMHPNIGI